MLRGAVPQVFFRVLVGPQPTANDFKSGRELGSPRPRNPENERLWEGLSVFGTEQQARNKAIDMRERGYSIGDYVARLEIPDESPVTWERTTNSRGHYTVFGQIHRLIDYVASVVPVDTIE